MIDAVELDTLAREQVLRQHVEAVTGTERRPMSASDLERRQFTDEFLRFANWASKCGVRSLPASGSVVGFYLLDLHAGGALVGDIERAADAIVFTHEAAGNYLDIRPVASAVAFIHRSR
jgi:hypothetical protein